jgi:hypothetical protein
MIDGIPVIDAVVHPNQRLSRVKGDQLDLRRPDGAELPTPYSTSAVADVAH